MTTIDNPPIHFVMEVVKGVSIARMFSDTASLGFGSTGAGEVFVRNFFSDEISAWTNTSDLYVGGSSNGAVGSGNIELGRNGLLEVERTMKIWEAGTVELNRGRLVAETIDTMDGGSLSLVSGKLELQSFLGDMTNQGARVQVEHVSGDLLNESGIVAPGPMVGSTTIGGSFTQRAGGTLAIDIGGRSPGVTHDLVGISGSAVFDGHLELSLIDNFVPDASDQFSLLGADSIVGVFENVATGNRVATADGGGSFVVHYGLGSSMPENRLIAYNFLASDALLGDFDFDLDGDLDDVDIDMLSRAVGTDDLGFDLVYDADINEADRERWVHDLMNTYFGDANLDGEFNSGDFVQVFQRGEYEDSIEGNSGWSDGDWNGDGDFDTADFVLAFQSGGYEMGPQANLVAVPEPSIPCLLVIALAGAFRWRR